MAAPVVIVGGGQAGLKVAEALHRAGVEERIVIIGDEPILPYQRPPLSKKYLLGEVSRDSLRLQQPEYFTRTGIDVVVGRRVEGIDSHTDRIVLDNGESLAFSSLVLATGSAPRLLRMAGAEKAGVHVIRSIADADRLRADLVGRERVAIIGAGYVGLEAAASFRSLGLAVSVIEVQDRILARVACPAISEFLTRAHVDHGVAFHRSTRVEGLLGGARVEAVAIAGANPVAADIVVVAAGGRPNSELAERAGIACDDGILVDSFGRTSRPRVYAAGDCARFPSVRYGRTLRLESVQNANDQARGVAETIAGRAAPYDPVPWFWSDQYEFKLQMAGLAGPEVSSEVEGSYEKGALAVTYYQGGTPIAVASINMPRVYMSVRRQLEAAVPA
ncbi:MAG: NAD(P)/FAD-dependent oxidoreductase [Hyphomicrobiaceae bacterium]